MAHTTPHLQSPIPDNPGQTVAAGEVEVIGEFPLMCEHLLECSYPHPQLCLGAAWEFRLTGYLQLTHLKRYYGSVS